MHLVLLPGLDGTGKLFDFFIRQFPDPENITVIQYPMDRYIPFEQLHDYIIPLLPTNIPLVLLGESYSGPVAISLSTRPELNIHGLILVATFAKYPSSLLKIVSNVLPLSLIFRLPLPDFIIRHYCFGDVGNKKIRDALRESVRENKARRAKGDGSIYKSLLLLILSKHIC